MLSRQLNYSKTPFLFYSALIITLVLSAFYRLQFDFNTGHIDEYGYLFVGKTLLAGKTWGTYNYIFGSDLNWYLFGIGDKYFGGLEGARIVSGFLGLISLAGFYIFVKTLWGSTQISVIATILLSTQAVHIFISRFATYDITSLMFFTLSLAPLILACREKDKIHYTYLITAIAFFSLAITSKYITILYLPFICLIALSYNKTVAFLFGLGISLILALYATLHWEGLKELYEIQISGVHVANSTYQDVAVVISKYLSLPLFFFTIAVIWLFWGLPRTVGPTKAKIFWTFLSLVILALPIALYHLRAQNIISLYKHLAFSLVFLIPIIAWFLSTFLDHLKNRHAPQILGVIIITGIVVLNLSHLQAMESRYPNLSEMIKSVEHDLGSKPDQTILTEDSYLFRYLAFDKMPQNTIKNTRWVDNNLDGKHEMKDVHNAIWDSKFTYVYLNDRFHFYKNEKIREILKQRGYELIKEKPYSLPWDKDTYNQRKLSLYKRINEPAVPFEQDQLFNRKFKSAGKQND